ncbi:MAG: DMT family transporter [Rhodospirillaceae bacterium]|jgi:drug/metabolite transporter (DMT)-like permease|nr:DMT family transporter [Rhodospirillaceae bacterium]MBT4426843.1 DMT family transporter [Rhodospirillaceae bacterium]MBT5039809.1 DMT family transporter [Rhodospirillaceae bacterium]MBT6829911.1 DMT family transporter [Rhodospirillaceae bacterium]MBT7292694.1 DMT family transporter [Rhodospirillaceae bacterium]
MTNSKTEAARAAWRSPGAIPILMLFVLGLSFAVVLVLNRIAVEGGVPFIPYVFWQSLGGFAILLLLALTMSGRPPLSWAHIRVYMVTGSLNLTIPYLIFAFVAAKVPTGILGLSLSLVPVTIYMLALIFRLDSFRIVRFFGILLGLAGILFVLLPEASLPSPDMVGWVALGFVAPLCYALNAVCVAMLRPPEGDSVQLASGLMFTGSVSMLVVMAVTGEWWAFEGSFGDGHWATLVAMANNALSFYLIFELIKRAGPVFFSMVNYVATLTAMGLGIWIFSDAHSIWIWAALVLIGASLVLVNFVSMRGR